MRVDTQGQKNQNINKNQFIKMKNRMKGRRDGSVTESTCDCVTCLESLSLHPQHPQQVSESPELELQLQEPDASAP